MCDLLQFLIMHIFLISNINLLNKINKQKELFHKLHYSDPCISTWLNPIFYQESRKTHISIVSMYVIA